MIWAIVLLIIAGIVIVTGAVLVEVLHGNDPEQD